MKTIFISYSREDEPYKDNLKKHLNLLRTFEIDDSWSVEQIGIGHLDEQRQKEMEDSDLIIYMLSYDFFSSIYSQKEVQRGMDLLKKRTDKKILCIIVSDFPDLDGLGQTHEHSNLNKLRNSILKPFEDQYLPYITVVNKATGNTEEKIIPLNQHPHIEKAFTQIVEKIKSLLTEPKEIWQLEKQYGIVLKELNEDLDPFEKHKKNNYYILNQKREIIVLNLANNQIQHIEGLEELTKLLTLDLGSNQIQQIKGLEKLTNLQILDLRSNQIKCIEGLEELTKLLTLNLGFNQIKHIKGLEKLDSLQELFLGYNQIEHIKGLEELTKLQKLFLVSNQIKHIEGLGELTKLLTLDLRNNKIERIKGLESLPNLQRLYLRSNQIKRIEGLVMTSLLTLDLGSNKIEHIEGLEKLTKLQRLYLGSNQIKQIKGLEKLTKLQILDLRSNQIHSAEDLSEIFKLKKLETLKVDNNPFLQETHLLLKENENHLDSVLSLLSEQKGEQQAITLPVKIMLLGNHASGKSSFLHYLQNDGNLADKMESTSILNIQPHPLKYDPLPQAMIYDFGGQDYYHGVYQAFFSLDAVNVLLWCNKYNSNQCRVDSDGISTRDFTREYWLHQLKYAFERRKMSEEPSSETLLLVQTHADVTNDQRINFKGDTDKFNIVNEFHVSLNQKVVAQNTLFNLGLQYLKATLLNQIERKRIPEKRGIYYKAFLEAILKSEDKDCIPIKTLLSSYDRKPLVGETEDRIHVYLKDDLKQLALRGMVLYYHNNKKLKEVVWINPSLTIEYIHKEILNHEIIRQHKGIITEVNFNTICPEENIRQLLLSEKVVFYDQRCNSSPRYIVPGYLPLSSAEGELHDLMVFGLTTPSFVLKFEYFIPFGLINQLICYYGGNAKLKQVWRDQLVFTYQQYKVWIQLDFTQLTIAVHVAAVDRTKSLQGVEQRLFCDIIDLYWGNDPVDARSESEEPQPDDMDEDGERGFWQDKDRLKSIKTPDDLYLSIDGKNFAYYKPLAKAKEPVQTISVYPLQEGTGDLDKAVNQTHPVHKYKNFINNKYIASMKKIFISYSRKDVDYKDELKTHLNLLRTFEIADNWSCEQISIGKWHDQIQKELEESDLIIYMLSANFFSSKYILEKEVQKGMDLINTNPTKKILCVIVSDFIGLDKLKQALEHGKPNELQDSILKINEYQYLPYGKKDNKVTDNSEDRIIPLKRHPHVEEALTQIVEKVQQVLV